MSSVSSACLYVQEQRAAVGTQPKTAKRSGARAASGTAAKSTAVDAQV